MDLEIIETVAEFRVVIDAGATGIAVKARIVKHAAEEATYWYETSLVYAEANSIGVYTPGATGSTLKETKSKLIDYLNNFQRAISNGGRYEHAKRYID
jgi:hypothetical protein